MSPSFGQNQLVEVTTSLARGWLGRARGCRGETIDRWNVTFHLEEVHRGGREVRGTSTKRGRTYVVIVTTDFEPLQALT